MNLTMIGSLAGGVGLFLLGMRLMTDGLKYAAGHSLRKILSRSTGTPLRGILSGAFITSLVQSSSAVTVATIGFVNAGLMDLASAITVVYGTNIGTTMTGWLVSLLGFHVDIMAFSLPAIGIGMFLRIVRHESRRGAMGDVLAGFGIFFIGVNILRQTFEGVGQDMQIASLAGEGILPVLLFLGIGFLMTLLMQSSSAAMAIILTATAGNVIPLSDAAAVVIGANVGTTSTAALAVVGATPNAKRLAGAHVIFNLATGFAALLLLPFLLELLGKIQILLGFDGSITVLLALFHTVFNLLGVAMLYPLTGTLVNFLNKRFRTAEEDEAQPRHLDRNVAGTPVLALQALAMELKRIGGIARQMGTGALSLDDGPSLRLSAERTVIDKLVDAVDSFCNHLQRASLPAEFDNQLPNLLRVSGYYTDVAELAVETAKIQSAVNAFRIAPELASEMAHYKKRAVKFLAGVDPDLREYSVSLRREELEDVKEEYRRLKSRFLRTSSVGELSVIQMVTYLDLIAHIRRIAEQAEKGARYLVGHTIIGDFNNLVKKGDDSRTA